MTESIASLAGRCGADTSWYWLEWRLADWGSRSGAVYFLSTCGPFSFSRISWERVFSWWWAVVVALSLTEEWQAVWLRVLFGLLLFMRGWVMGRDKEWLRVVLWLAGWASENISSQLRRSVASSYSIILWQVQALNNNLLWCFLGLNQIICLNINGQKY